MSLCRKKKKISFTPLWSHVFVCSSKLYVWLGSVLLNILNLDTTTRLFDEYLLFVDTRRTCLGAIIYWNRLTDQRRTFLSTTILVSEKKILNCLA